MKHIKVAPAVKNQKSIGSALPLYLLNEGDCGRVSSIFAQGSIRRRLLDLGLIEGTLVECLHKSVYGDPIAYAIRGAAIALRQEDSSRIWVTL